MLTLSGREIECIAKSLTELSKDDPEMQNYIITQGMRHMSGLDCPDLVLTESEAPHCLHCGRPNDGTVSIRRENTAYCDDVKNWLISCRACFDWRDERWAEQWEDYYGMVM